MEEAVFEFSEESDSFDDCSESANQSVQSLVNEKSEETIVSTPFLDIQVKVEKSVRNSRTEALHATISMSCSCFGQFWGFHFEE